MSATFSKCGKFRYTLERRWLSLNSNSAFRGDVLWVMLNPSTADATLNDPTVTRCIGYSKAWGYSGLMVGNLYAYRATDPDALWDAAKSLYVIGSENDQYLCRMAGLAKVIVAAWGSHADPQRAAAVARMLAGYGPLYCIGKTKDGQPWHPLYKAKDLRPVLFKLNVTASTT